MGPNHSHPGKVDFVDVCTPFPRQSGPPENKCHMASGLNQRDRATAGFVRVRSHGKLGKKIDVRGFSYIHRGSQSPPSPFWQACGSAFGSHWIEGAVAFAVQAKKGGEWMAFLEVSCGIDRAGWAFTSDAGYAGALAPQQRSTMRTANRTRPISLVVNTATTHLVVVTGSIPIWVTTPQRRERWGSGFNSRKSPPRPGKVWACDGQRFILGFEPVT